MKEINYWYMQMHISFTTQNNMNSSLLMNDLKNTVALMNPSSL